MKKLTLQFFLLMLFSTNSWATWTKVQEGSAYCSSSGVYACTVTLSAVGSGHLLVAMFGSDTATYSAMSCNSSGCGTWVHPAGCYVDNSAQNTTLDCAYVLSSSSGATTVTETYTGSSSVYHEYLYVAEYSFTGSSAAFDVDGVVDNESGFNSNVTGVGLTLTGTNDVIVQQLNMNASGISPSGINGAYTDWTDFSQAYSGAAGAKNTTTGTAPTWTNSSGHTTMNAIAFNEVTTSSSFVATNAVGTNNVAIN